ncbi:hypothetical protein DYB32_002074 [Aphanomyces invadans]|uniref:Uncharacterized protein n=1 Tax=Aphanomyces invadans TaxID=157072 RepID=A0A3R6VF48_9STRA|nr:hypothetical protein DYB32_002074 [Aphanomyces invadans]
MLRGRENSVPTDAAAAAEPGPLPYVRKRSLQHVATHDDRLRVMTWMLAKEQTLLSESDSDGTSSAVKSDASSTKMAKVDRLCLATQAIAEFPHLFRGSAQANYMKASRWWKESREYIYGTAARTGRGRKTNAWTLWLQEELKATLEMERSTTTTWHNKDLLVMAKSILDNSTHPEFNKDYIVPQRNCALGDLVNLRWVQNFKEKFQRQHAGHHHDGSAMAFAGHAYPPRQTDLDEAMEAKLLQTLATIRATKDGPLVKKDVMHMANQLIREAHPMFKVDTTWYRGFCDRHPELAVASSAKDMPQRLPQSRSPVFLAAERGDLKLVKLLVRFGANVAARDMDDSTAILAAAKNGHGHVVDFLTKKGTPAAMSAMDGAPLSLLPRASPTTESTATSSNGTLLHTSEARSGALDDDDNVSIGSLMKKGKKSHAAKLEDRLRLAHGAAAQSSSPPVTVQTALDMIESALATLTAQLENSNRNSVRKCLAKIDDGLRGLRSKTHRDSKTTPTTDTSVNTDPATPDNAPHTPSAMDATPSLVVTLKLQKSAQSSTLAAPPSQPSHRAYDDAVIQDLSSIPLDSSLPQGVSLQLAFTPDSFCEGIRWPVVMFDSFDVAKSWGMDVTMLQLLHPNFDVLSDRVLFYFARANTMQDLNQLAVLPLVDAAPIAWTFDANTVSADELYQLAMQQAAQFAAALCPLHAIELLAHCAAAAASYEFSTPDQLADATAQLKTAIESPTYTESQLVLYASWPILQDDAGWTVEPSATTGVVTFVGADGTRHSSRLAALRCALASASLTSVHQVAWSYLRNAQIGRDLDKAAVECAGARYPSVQDAVQAYFGGTAPASPRGAVASDVAETSVDSTASPVPMHKVLAVLVSNEYGWSESSDSVGPLYCRPSYATTTNPVMGTDFFRSVTDVELYLTSHERGTWDRILDQVSNGSAGPPSKRPTTASPHPKAKKRKVSGVKSKSKFVATFASVFAYLETKGWFRTKTEAGWCYYKPNADVATAERGKTMFATADELETYLKASSVWSRVAELLKQEHTTSALIEGDACGKIKPPAKQPKPDEPSAAARPKKAPRVSSRSMVVSAAAPEFKPTFSKVYSELQKEGWFHRNGQFGWCYYKPGTVVKQAKLDEDLFSNEVHLEQYLKSSGEWQRIVDQKNRQLQELYGFYPPAPVAETPAPATDPPEGQLPPP